MIITNNINLRQSNLKNDLINTVGQVFSTNFELEKVKIVESSQPVLKDPDASVNINTNIGKITRECISDIDLTNATTQEAHQKIWYLYMNNHICWWQKSIASDVIVIMMERLGVQTSVCSDARFNFIELLESNRSTLENSNVTFFDGNGEPLEVDLIKHFEEVLALFKLIDSHDNLEEILGLVRS